MEVTLEKIELVKDRTGVTYKEAKEALEACDGNVVDAIVAIEDKTDGQTQSDKIGAKGGELLDKMKEIVKRGNVARIIVKKDEESLLNLPLNAGIVGAVVAPWGIILGVCASFGFNCTIEFVKDDGSVIDITEKAGEVYEQAKEKGNEVYEQMREKAPDAFDAVKEKGEAAVNKAKEVVDDAKEKFGKGKKADVPAEPEGDTVDLGEGVVDLREDAKEAVKDAKDNAKSTAEGVQDAVEEIKDSDL